MGILENKFNEEMLNIYATAKRELKYNATRFLQIVSKEGGVAAAKQLIAKDDGTYGFSVLWENNRLDLSVEALVLKPEYGELFSVQEIDQCKERLVKFGYMVENE